LHFVSSGGVANAAVAVMAVVVVVVVVVVVIVIVKMRNESLILPPIRKRIVAQQRATVAAISLVKSMKARL